MSTAAQDGAARPPAAGLPGDPIAPRPTSPAPRWRRMLPPVATMVGLAIALVYVRAVDPNEPGHYPACPTLALFGIDCPGCGGLRATHALAHGDLGAALDHNIGLVIAVPILAVLALRWIVRSWTGRPPPPPSATAQRTQRLVAPVLIGGLVAYTVLRNVVPYLDSGLS